MTTRFNPVCHGSSIKQLSLLPWVECGVRLHTSRARLSKRTTRFRDGPQCGEIFRSETANSKVGIPFQRSAGEDPPFSNSLFYGAPTTIQWATAMACPTGSLTSTARLSIRGCIANVSSCASGIPIRWPRCSGCGRSCRASGGLLSAITGRSMLVPNSGCSTPRQTAQKRSTQGRTSISHDQTLRGCASRCI